MVTTTTVPSSISTTVETPPLPDLTATVPPLPDLTPQVTERERFADFVCSDLVRHRLLYSRRLGLVAQSDLDLVVNALEPLSNDSEHLVRVSMAQDLSTIYREAILQDCISLVRPVIFAVIERALLSDTYEFRSAALESTLKMCPLLPASILSSEIFMVVERMTNPHMSDTIRSDGIALLLRMCEWMKPDSMPRVRELAQLGARDASFRVRKSVARYVFVLGSDFISVAEILSRDPIWTVRQGVVRGLVGALRRIESRELRRDFLIPQIKRAAVDSCRWIRKDVHAVFGAFIFALALDQIDHELLSMFTTMSSMCTNVADMDSHFSCAFNFPAVATRIGRSRWEEISSSYMALCRDPMFKVRRTLSYSLHIVFQVVGPDIADRELLPIFELFFKDLDEVKQGVIEHLSDLFGAMSLGSRLKYIDMLWEVQHETQHNWRYRSTLASQLIPLSSIYPTEIVCTRLIPLALALMHDRVAHVRQTAVRSIGNLLMLIQGPAPDAHQELLAECIGLASADSCHDRQLYLILCESLMATIPSDIFRMQFLPSFMKLARDPVINVRRLLVRIIDDLPDDQRLRLDPIMISGIDQLHQSESLILASPQLISSDGPDNDPSPRLLMITAGPADPMSTSPHPTSPRASLGTDQIDMKVPDIPSEAVRSDFESTDMPSSIDMEHDIIPGEGTASRI